MALSPRSTNANHTKALPLRFGCVTWTKSSFDSSPLILGRFPGLHTETIARLPASPRSLRNPGWKIRSRKLPQDNQSVILHIFFIKQIYHQYPPVIKLEIHFPPDEHGCGSASLLRYDIVPFACHRPCRSIPFSMLKLLQLSVADLWLRQLWPQLVC